MSGIAKIIFLNKYTKGKSREQIWESLKNLKDDETFIKIDETRKICGFLTDREKNYNILEKLR